MKWRSPRKSTILMVKLDSILGELMKNWIGNKTSVISTSGFHNNSKHDRESNDFYATEPIALEKLLVKETFSNVWECACGVGNLSEVLKTKGLHGKSSDLIDRGYGEKIDFLNHNIDWLGDIITNPPYKISTEFVYKALKTLKIGRKLALLFPQRYLSSKGRYKLFIEHPPIKLRRNKCQWILLI